MNSYLNEFIPNKIESNIFNNISTDYLLLNRKFSNQKR